MKLKLGKRRQKKRKPMTVNLQRRVNDILNRVNESKKHGHPADAEYR